LFAVRDVGIIMTSERCVQELERKGLLDRRTLIRSATIFPSLALTQAGRDALALYEKGQ
jgi:hypothetical protein